MTITPLEILSLVLAAVAVGACFFPRIPAVIPAWLSLLVMYFAGAPYCGSQVLVFWSVASLLVLMLRILQPKALTLTTNGNSYVVVATIAGTAVGYVCAPAAAAIIIGAAAGAFLGTVAYMSLPKGPHIPVASSEFIQYLCAKGLPAVVCCAMAAIVFAMAI